jgi:glycosyltransferase involved in cell wall biosynthesis
MAPAAAAESVPALVHLHAAYSLRERCAHLLHFAPFVVGCSAAAVQGLVDDRLPSARLDVIHNGVVPARILDAPARDLRGALRIPSDAFVVAGIGSLLALKGFDLLLAAAAECRERGIPIHVVIGGAGPERAALEAQAQTLGLQERVHFLGEVADTGAVLRGGVDVFALPSRMESFGLVYAEAGLCGLPVVGTRVGGIPEVVAHERTGLLVRPEAVGEVANALAMLAAQPLLARALGEEGRRVVLADFTIDVMVRRFHARYEALVASPPDRTGAWPLAMRSWSRWIGGIAARRLKRS